jgi:hypothetical protein
MKKQINQLKSLSQKCQVFASKVNLERNAFTSYKVENDDKSEVYEISIYVGHTHDTIAVYFSKNYQNQIQVHLYSDTITFPMSLNINEIKENIVVWSNLFDDDFNVEIEKYNLEKKLIIQKKIQDLENELKNI